MIKKVSVKIAPFLIFTLSLFLIIACIPGSLATNQTHEIANFEDLVKYAELSRTKEHYDDTYLLTNDIIITEEDQKTLESKDFKYISFGSEDYPFAGTFDGNNHTIKNLKYSSTLKVNPDTGLFSRTSGATIKNLVIDYADIQSDYRGGIVSGYSENTLFLNINVKNSHLFVSSINNVVTLITDGGIRGGVIVGESVGSTLYNCESENNLVNTNNTSGVAALAGKGLTLGGLVGIADNTEIEYSRVKKGSVKSYYDVAVGALGGNTIYVGGIVGKMKNASKVIDSYSTASLDYYCATYVSVGAGNSGHIGGITAVMEGDKGEILRSHYAGVATSKQYNAVLVVPIVQENLNISGIADIYEGGLVSDTYFKPSLNKNASMNVLGDAKSTESYGPLSDDKYSNKDFFQSRNYDLYGTSLRESSYKEPHYNKWVIDESQKIPIHGHKVSATLDFKSAGSVKIDKTSLVDASVSSSDPFNFAVQAISDNEKKVNLSATQNDGYRFVSWYKVSNVTAWSLEKKYDFFSDLFNKYKQISDKKDYDNVNCADNDLFVARYQAKVVFHDLYGNIIDKETGKKVNDIDDVNDWYYYNDKIPSVEPFDGPASANAKLIGWTTIPSKTGGYNNISSDELSNLKASNEFYKANDKVVKALDLYPVYVDSLSNIITIFEGNELDSSTDKSLRENVGKTTVLIDNDNVVINVVGLDENGNLPDGYRFLGWYDEDETLVSKEKKYVLSNVDLTKKHTYTAKFEYEVKYYVRAFAQGNGSAFTDSELYTSKYQKYNTPFDNIAAPAYIREHITHWGENHVDHEDSDDLSDAYSSLITAPISVFSHNYENATGSATAYQLYVDTDFPASGRIIDLDASMGAEFEYIPINKDRYNLEFWTLERKREGWTYIKNPMSTGILDPSIMYKARAMVTANIVFHKKSGETYIVKRRYNDKVLQQEDKTYTYKYPFMHTSDVVSTEPVDGAKGDLSSTITLKASLSDASMELHGYAFLGFISSLDVEENSNTWNKIYNVSDDPYSTTNISLAKKYLVDNSKTVTETMDLYPVYAKYDVKTKVNIVSNDPTSNINVPNNPGYTLTKTENEYQMIVNINPDLDTFVIGDSGDKYNLVSIDVTCDGKDKKTIKPNEDGLYNYTISAGKEYVFTANYEPYVLVYHLDGSKTSVMIKENKESVGDIPTPLYDITKFGNDYIFVGYTRTKPNDGYFSFTSYDLFKEANISIITSSMLVTESMELWPVYVSTNININSNVDDYLIKKGLNPTSIRSYQVKDKKKILLTAKDISTDNYYFAGWYKNFSSLNNMGTLMCSNKECLLDEEEALKGNSYTAVYKKIYNINYYDTFGNVLYEVKVYQDDTRTFMQNKEDSNGFLVSVPIDIEAFEKINSNLDNNQFFINFSWIKDDGTIIDWDSFKNETIKEDMSLYPLVEEVTVTNSNNVELDLKGDNPNVLFGSDKNTLYASFNMIYEEPTVNLHIESILYGKNKIKIKDNSNSNVSFYANSNIENSPLDSKTTDENGDATFKLYGIVTIKKEVIPNKNGNEAFIFKITNTNQLDKVLQPFAVKEGEFVNVKLPYGSYTISEDNIWAWRYKVQTSKNFKINNSQDVELKFVNERINNKWFDYASYKKNIFK